MNKLEIENGKYQIENNNGIVKVYRYGELWLDGATKFELCLIHRIEELEQQNKRYCKALEFYADEKSWMNRKVTILMDGEPTDAEDCPAIFDDGGNIARKALEGEGNA